jgi:hypothetical protein
VHNVHNKKNTQEIARIELETKDFLPLSNESSLCSLNKKSQSCLGIPALHFMPTFILNVNNFECTQQHCSVQNENLGWMFTNAHPKNQNLKV